MNTPSVFRHDNLQTLQENLKNLLNGCRDFENEHIIESPRSVGDAVQQVLAKKMASCFPDGIIRNFQGDFARRAMADVAFEDADDFFLPWTSRRITKVPISICRISLPLKDSLDFMRMTGIFL